MDQSISMGASASRSRILIVDDQPQIRCALRTALVAKGYEVNDASGGDEAFEKLREEKYDVILLEINLPNMKGTDADKVAALGCGANDYVTKPFSTPELFARIRAVLRRHGADREVQRLRLKDLEVDFAAREGMVRGHGVHLTPKEFELLQYLPNRLNKIVQHREILRTNWGPDYGDELNQLRTVVKQLRKRIEADPAEPQYLLTHSWVGYELRAPKESAALPQYNITLNTKLQTFRSVA